MSYTMTIETPEKAAWFEQRRQRYSEKQLGDLFIAFLMKQDVEMQENERIAPISPRVHALRGVVRLPEDFDYTEWRKDHLFVGETVDTLVDKIRAFESEHPELEEVTHA